MDRFLTCAAYWIIASRYHTGLSSKGYAKVSQLSRSWVQAVRRLSTPITMNRNRTEWDLRTKAPVMIAADGFVLSAGANTIDGIDWWGTCLTACPIGDFTVFIYTNLNPPPRCSGLACSGTVLASYSAGNANQTLTRNTVAGGSGPEYSYSLDIPALTPTAGTEYWLGISNDTSSSVFWQMEFTVPASPLPEPSSVFLLGAGTVLLFCIAGFRRA